MAITRHIQTNFSKGELSPLVEGRPDLTGYNEGCRTLENFLLLRQAVATRRPGLRFIAEVKNSSTDAILIPFEAGLSNSFVIEAGNTYMRFFKNKAQLESSPGVPIEIASPYSDANIRVLHFTQSVDVLFFFQALFRQRRLNRLSDLVWTLTDIAFRPPPSFEKDTDVSDPTLIGEIGGEQGIPPPVDPPGGGGVGGGGDSGTDGGDGGSGGGDGGDGGGGDP